MIITVDVESVFAMVGTAVCVIVPLVIALGLYANFRVVRREGGEKWTP